MKKLMHADLERKYILYKPENLPKESPLVVFLHWYTGNAQDIINFTDFNDIADKYGFGVVYPEGLLDIHGNKHWNSNLDISNFDDVGFIELLVQTLVKEHHFNSKDIFVTGISNGGFMSYSLANNIPHLFSAFAPVIGTMSKRDWKERTSKNPVPILHICGLDDEVVPPYKKNDEGEGWGGAPNVDIIMRHWADKAGCDEPITEQLGSKTTIDYYDNGIDDLEVWCVKISDHGHDYPTKKDDIDGGELLWRFFSKYVDNK